MAQGNVIETNSAETRHPRSLGRRREPDASSIIPVPVMTRSISNQILPHGRSLNASEALSSRSIPPTGRRKLRQNNANIGFLGTGPKYSPRSVPSSLPAAKPRDSVQVMEDLPTVWLVSGCRIPNVRACVDRMSKCICLSGRFQKALR